jgi:hypothetical protein
MVPFQLVIMISSASARPYEHEPSPRPKQYLILRKEVKGLDMDTFFPLFKFLEKTERSWKNSAHD